MHRHWWKKTTVYHVYPRSFSDSNGDGIGDLPGLIERLDYLHALGVETLWISPFFGSPQADFGYDISDHFSVAPEHGTHDDFDRLVEEVHARGMRVVLDMVLNHTSDQHPWFLASRSARDDRHRDWYIWRDGRKPGGAAPPNNWRSMLGPSGWHYDANTDQWYWASFLPFQPDLNYRNPDVKRAMLDVVRHWLGKGVDGLRLDIFNAIYKDESFADNPFSLRPLPSEENPDGFFQRHRHTINHPDTFAFARELRAVVDEFSDPPRFLVGEVFGSTPVLKRYLHEEEAGPTGPTGPTTGKDGLHLVFLFKTMRTAYRADAFRALIEEYEAAFPDPFMPTYVLGNHDRPRAVVRLGDDPAKARLLATLQLTARGVPFIYYGEEIGMPHVEVPKHEARDPVAARFRRVPRWLARRMRRWNILVNRDECRAPMAWHDGPNGGFAPAHATPWLPLAEGSNVAAQEGDPSSLLSMYRRFIALRRKSPALHAGRIELHPAGEHPRDVLGYRRVHDGAAERATVLLNFAARESVVDLRAHAGSAVVSNLESGERAATTSWTLRPHEGIVIIEART